MFSGIIGLFNDIGDAYFKRSRKWKPDIQNFVENINCMKSRGTGTSQIYGKVMSSEELDLKREQIFNCKTFKKLDKQINNKHPKTS